MQITISNHSKEPIYEQITTQIKSLILTGSLQKVRPSRLSES